MRIRHCLSSEIQPVWTACLTELFQDRPGLGPRVGLDQGLGLADQGALAVGRRREVASQALHTATLARPAGCERARSARARSVERTCGARRARRVAIAVSELDLGEREARALDDARLVSVRDEGAEIVLGARAIFRRGASCARRGYAPRSIPGGRRRPPRKDPAAHAARIDALVAYLSTL
jgi:hypothetical protein